MKSKVALVKGSNRRENICRAMELIQEELTPKVCCQDVIVKPNCLRAATPLSCTHVDALRGIMDSLSHWSPESVTVAEICNDREHFESFRKLGYTSLSQEYSTSLSDPAEEDDWVEMSLLTNDFQEVTARVSKSVVDCKCRISAAVAKTHDTVIMTASGMVHFPKELR